MAVTGAGQNGVFRHTAMEQALSANFSPGAIANIVTPPDGMNSDIHAQRRVRAHLVGSDRPGGLRSGALAFPANAGDRRQRRSAARSGDRPECLLAPLVLEACRETRVEDAAARDCAATRLSRAEALGITYRAYTLEILERGVHL